MIVEVHQEAAPEDFTDSVDLVPTYLPYNTFPESSSDSSDHDHHNSEEIKKISNVVDAIIVRRCHEVLFCCGFGFWTHNTSCLFLLRNRR